jgi:hypothetical protein
LFAGTTVADPGLDSDCYLTAEFKVSYTGTGGFVGSGNAAYGKIVSSAARQSGNTAFKSDITLLANTDTFGAGTVDASITVTVKVTYSMPGQTATKTFQVNVLPTSKLVQQCSAHTADLISYTTGEVGIQEYVVGATKIDVAHPTWVVISLNTPELMYSNTLIPTM